MHPSRTPTLYLYNDFSAKPTTRLRARVFHPTQGEQGAGAVAQRTLLPVRLYTGYTPPKA